MKLVVGLGNPDKQYHNTFHNLGFLSVDKTAEFLGVSFSKQKCKADIAETKINGEKVIIAKPLTYMNLSGESIKALIDFYKISLDDLIVIYDDFDLKKGEVRIREKGSSGTHNGMRNIISLLSSENFARIRIGFNPGKENRIPLIDLVLSGIKAEDEELFSKATEWAGKAGYDFARGVKIQDIMQKYNGKL